MLGSVLTVSGSQMTVRLHGDGGNEMNSRIGAMVKSRCMHREVVGSICAVQADIVGMDRSPVLVVDLVGELFGEQNAQKFSRGVSHHPVPGAPVFAMTEDDMRTVFSHASESSIRIGALYDDQAQTAFVQMNDMLSKHFAVLGASGSGKSCTVALLLNAILEHHPNAHMLLLDPHNEYATAFGDRADVVNVENLKLPFWMLDSDEAARVLVRGGTAPDRETQALVLRDLIVRARRHYAGDSPGAASITVDTPVPYRISDLLRFLNEAMGKLDRPDTTMPYLRLRSRLESLKNDKRYAFMFFEGFDVPDTLPELVGRLLRLPVDGKPIAIFDLSGVPSEVTDVVVSVCGRIIFDFAVWVERERMPPVLLVCEEAHRYVPADDERGFAATARTITRIAKEGRKYSLALALVTQRPSELSPEALSQCGTIFALRLTNELDQEFVARAVPDAARGMLSALPSLPTQQAIITGEGAPIPMRVRIDDLPPGRRPRSEAAEFSKAWRDGAADVNLRDEAVRRWRMQAREV
jgi:DNA helicase HerA-like ATPase